MRRMAEPVCLDSNALEARAAFAERLAEAAGAAILPHFRRKITVDDKGSGGDFDPVTEADRAAERAMRELIEQHYPDDGILGEEFPEKPSRNGLRWILDPIDGTRAFISGLPSWGVLIALNDGTRPVLGAVCQPYLGELFLGVNGAGLLRATLNGTAISCRPCPNLANAVASTTGLDFLPEADCQAFYRLAAEVRMVRYGFDCYAYAVLALGFIDLVAESQLQTYDVQALIPLIEAAGGRVTSWEGGDAQHGGRILAAGDARLHAAAIRLLQPAGPV